MGDNGNNNNGHMHFAFPTCVCNTVNLNVMSSLDTGSQDKWNMANNKLPWNATFMGLTSARVQNPFNKCIFFFVCMWTKGQTNQIFTSLKLDLFHKTLLYCLYACAFCLMPLFVCGICWCYFISKKQQQIKGTQNQSGASQTFLAGFFTCVRIKIHLPSRYTENDRHQMAFYQLYIPV